jgi:hypothetical protein
MATKYILSRDQFLLNESVNTDPLISFFSEIGPALSEMLDTVDLTLPKSVSDEFIKTSQQYSAALINANFTNEAHLEHILYSLGTSGVEMFTESNFQIQPIIDQYYSMNEGIIDIFKYIWNALTEEGSPSGIAHLLLDIVGFIEFPILPPFTLGMFADLINAIWYLFEGQYGTAIISVIAAAIPFYGDLAKGLKLSKGFGQINKISEVAFKTGRADKAALEILSKEDPKTFAKFLEIMQQAKPVTTVVKEIIRAIARGIEVLLRSFPLSMIAGKQGKKIGEWLENAAKPITKNLNDAIDEIGLITQKSKDLTSAIKAGDASKISDDVLQMISKLSDELAAAKRAGNVAEINRIEGLLQSAAEKGMPGAGQFVLIKSDGLLNAANSNIKLTDELLSDPTKVKDLQKAIEAGWDETVEGWTTVKKAMGETFSSEDLNKLKNLKELYVEMRMADILATGLRKLDDIPAEDLVRILGSNATTAAKGSSFSAKLIAEISDDPVKMRKFFLGILSDPKTLAKLEEAGPNVVNMYRLFAKNPEVVVDIAKSGLNSAARFDSIMADAGKWTRAVVGSRLKRNKLILAKNIIGAPLRCPVASLGQGNIGGLDALLGDFVGESSSQYKNLLSRNQFLFEEESAGDSSVSKQIDQQIASVKGKIANQQRQTTIGPASYVDICQSHIRKVVEDLAKTATIPATDSKLGTGEKPTFDPVGPASEDAIINQEMVDETLSQNGIQSGVSSTGTITALPSDATQLEVAAERISIDSATGGLWYLLGSVMTGDRQYSSVEYQIKATLAEYEKRGERVSDNVKNTGEIGFYPTSREVAWIKSELAELDADPTYKPRFFGARVTGVDLLKNF